MDKSKPLNVYALHLEGQYQGGLKIVAARDKKEAHLVASYKDQLSWGKAEKLPVQTKLKRAKVIVCDTYIE